ncbi:hypothetical protein TCON_1746 [Astathelohania contejeani]|uniref:Uncharacterized protein n=1 Tax=Astathelohania contejeani TaxID=164912 RepID=A0ABQ7HY05_9MICR|nr:hypothetical protein TCON_1746 [Thelohania contejeani]
MNVLIILFIWSRVKAEIFPDVDLNKLFHLTTSDASTISTTSSISLLSPIASIASNITFDDLISENKGKEEKILRDNIDDAKPPAVQSWISSINRAVAEMLPISKIEKKVDDINTNASSIRTAIEIVLKPENIGTDAMKNILSEKPASLTFQSGSKVIITTLLLNEETKNLVSELFGKNILNSLEPNDTTISSTVPSTFKEKDEKEKRKDIKSKKIYKNSKKDNDKPNPNKDEDNLEKILSNSPELVKELENNTHWSTISGYDGKDKILIRIKTMAVIDSVRKESEMKNKKKEGDIEVLNSISVSNDKLVTTSKVTGDKFKSLISEDLSKPNTISTTSKLKDLIVSSNSDIKTKKKIKEEIDSNGKPSNAKKTSDKKDIIYESKKGNNEKSIDSHNKSDDSKSSSKGITSKSKKDKKDISTKSSTISESYPIKLESSTSQIITSSKDAEKTKTSASSKKSKTFTISENSTTSKDITSKSSITSESYSTEIKSITSSTISTSKDEEKSISSKDIASKSKKDKKNSSSKSYTTSEVYSTKIKSSIFPIVSTSKQEEKSKTSTTTKKSKASEKYLSSKEIISESKKDKKSTNIKSSSTSESYSMEIKSSLKPIVSTSKNEEKSISSKEGTSKSTKDKRNLSIKSSAISEIYSTKIKSSISPIINVSLDKEKSTIATITEKIKPSSVSEKSISLTESTSESKKYKSLQSNSLTKTVSTETSYKPSITAKKQSELDTNSKNISSLTMKKDSTSTTIVSSKEIIDIKNSSTEKSDKTDKLFSTTTKSKIYNIFDLQTNKSLYTSSTIGISQSSKSHDATKILQNVLFGNKTMEVITSPSTLSENKITSESMKTTSSITTTMSSINKMSDLVKLLENIPKKRFSEKSVSLSKKFEDFDDGKTLFVTGDFKAGIKNGNLSQSDKKNYKFWGFVASSTDNSDLEE